MVLRPESVTIWARVPERLVRKGFRAWKRTRMTLQVCLHLFAVSVQLRVPDEEVSLPWGCQVTNEASWKHTSERKQNTKTLPAPSEIILAAKDGERNYSHG